MSPRKKKTKLESTKKREHDSDGISNKRRKSESTLLEEDKKSNRRKNFVKACEQVSYKAYLNYAKRFNLIYLPKCSNPTACTHQDLKSSTGVKQIPKRIEESFKIEMKSNTWSEALEVCFLYINPSEYLSDTVLKDIVEIMLNAHEDTTADYTMSNLIDRCQEVLSLNFHMHPPCMMKSIRKCYLKFLTSPMDLKQNTFTNRTKYSCDKGIVKYCFNRLEYELCSDSKDEALIDKFENTPEEMKQSVHGLHWQKEKFEIFELLNRSERIERLMAVLETLIELLQFDLTIWHSRYTNNLGCHIMRSHKPLMAYILWSTNILYTGAVNMNCRQILRLFVYFVHLEYPEHHIKTMTIWLNTMIQTFYICENNSNSDYPNTGKYCMAFANEFYKIITEMPPSSILRVLEKIRPTFMRYLISKEYLNSILSTKEEEIIKTLINFIENSQWKNFLEPEKITELPKTLRNIHIKPNKLMTYLTKVLKNTKLINKCNRYPKFKPLEPSKIVFDQNFVVLLIYITFHAYLDAFSVPEVQKTLDTLNEQLEQETPASDKQNTSEFSSYSVTESFIKKYRSIFQMLKVLIMILQKMKLEQKIPEILKIFESIHLLGL